jgi:hypothetical protein
VAGPKALGSGQPFTFSLDVRKVGQWEEARDRVGPRSIMRIKRAARLAMRRQAQFARRMIVQGITRQAPGGDKFKPLSPTTLAIRQLRGFRGKKALIVRADLRNSVTVKTTPEGAFIGILKGARSRDGSRLVNVGLVHEEGRTFIMRVTPKMLALLHKAFREAGIDGGGGGGMKGSTASGSILIIKIPARPFIKPVFDKYFADSKKTSFRVLLEMARILKGDYGYPGG